MMTKRSRSLYLFSAFTLSELGASRIAGRRYGKNTAPAPIEDMPWVDVATGSLGQGLAVGLGIVAAVLGIGLAVAHGSVRAAVAVFYAILTVTLFVPLIGALVDRHASRRQGLAAVLAGVSVLAAVYLATDGRGYGLLSPALAGVLASAVAFVLARPRVRG